MGTHGGHLCGCMRRGWWRKCAACNKHTCSKCSSPESGRRNAARKIVAWRCKSCDSREVQKLDFDGEKVWAQLTDLVKSGVSNDHIGALIARHFSMTEILRAMTARVIAETRLPDVVNAPTPEYDKEMRRLAVFAEAERIECVNTPIGDLFVLTKRGRKLTIQAVPHGRDDARLDVEDHGVPAGVADEYWLKYGGEQ